ncbi:hypothetical protein [Paenibacillus sp. QZ-Y1]|uniref:hypothetical protein n=1 Tax=Paenibacillus sp. QZ-Y1 TaxID=3414511 RepID=UPI003F79ABEC
MKFKKTCIIFTTFIFLLLVSACDSKVVEDYPASFFWQDEVYLIEGATVDSSKVGEKIGSIIKKVAPFPQNEGESNVAEEGSVIYLLKGDSSHEKLIIRWNNEFHLAQKQL